MEPNANTIIFASIYTFRWPEINVAYLQPVPSAVRSGVKGSREPQEGGGDPVCQTSVEVVVKCECLCSKLYIQSTLPLLVVAKTLQIRGTFPLNAPEFAEKVLFKSLRTS